MNHKTRLIFNLPTIALLLAMAGGCGTINTMEEAKGVAGGLSRDIWRISKKHPVAERLINYENTEKFDHVLSASLRATVVSDVDVLFNPRPNLKKLDPRLEQWFTKVQKSGGKVYTCKANLDQSSEVVMAIGKILLNYVKEKWVEWETYRPADEFHAEIIVADTESLNVESITFVRRAGYTERPSCNEVEAKTK